MSVLITDIVNSTCKGTFLDLFKIGWCFCPSRCDKRKCKEVAPAVAGWQSMGGETGRGIITPKYAGMRLKDRPHPLVQK